MPSTVSVISALRAEVEENDRRPFGENKYKISTSVESKMHIDVPLFRQSEQATRGSQPFDAGLDTTETSLNIL